VLRAYDERGWIHETPGSTTAATRTGPSVDIFAAPEVVLIHSRNIAYGCYMFSITRDGAQAEA